MSEIISITGPLTVTRSLASGVRIQAESVVPPLPIPWTATLSLDISADGVPVVHGFGVQTGFTTKVAATYTIQVSPTALPFSGTLTIG